MPNCCSIINCRTGYKWSVDDFNTKCAECKPGCCDCSVFDCKCKTVNCGCSCKACKPKVFAFPRDDVERDNWIRACPNVFPEGIRLFACEWHWPEGYETVSPAKSSHLCGRRPKNPPSIFRGIPGSCSRSTISTPRASERTSPAARNNIPDEIQQDTIQSFTWLK